jgi:hypothetical protein
MGDGPFLAAFTFFIVIAQRPFLIMPGSGQEEAYRQWDADADPAERDALDAFAAHDDKTWAAG